MPARTDISCARAPDAAEEPPPPGDEAPFGALSIDVIVADPRWRAALPAPAEGFVEGWARAACLHAPAYGHRARGGDVAVRLTDDAEMRRLNRDYRGKDAATNVLAFPEDPAPVPAGPAARLGDLALGYETLCREAGAQGKSVGDHAAHLIVHGALHLLGFDHMDDADAARMEAAERAVLAAGGIADPYAAAGADARHGG